MFKVKGKLLGREVEVKWDKGKLTGDDVAVRMIESEAEIREIVGPPAGPYTEENHLESELSASELVQIVLDYNTIEGDLPQVIPDPEGGRA